MKILWLSHLVPYPPKGGVLQRSYNLLKEVSRYHQIDLMAFNQRSLIYPLFSTVEIGIGEAMDALGLLCRRLAFFEIPVDQVRYGLYWCALKSLLTEPYTINWLKSKHFAVEMCRWLKQENYDLIHFDTISLLPYLSLVKSGHRISLGHHNIESHMLLRRSKREKNFLKKFYFWQEGRRLSRYEHRFCPKVSLNITCSDLDTRRLKRIAPRSRSVTIPNGVDLDYFKIKRGQVEDNRLIFAGRMNWYPNIEAVLFLARNLWPALKSMNPQLVCDIIGANPPFSVLAEAKELSGFNVHGFVEDVRPYLQKAAVYVCPIRDGGGTKLKILDAMAMGKAIVAHPVACEGIDVCNKRNVLFAETDSDFIEGINFLLRNPDKRDQLGTEARKLIERFYCFKNIGKKLSDSFEGSLADNRVS